MPDVIRSLVAAPSAEPLSDLVLAKQQCRVEHGEDDGLIALEIAAARQFAETFTRRQFFTATWDLLLPCFPRCRMELPVAPLRSVSFVKYFDFDGAEQTVDPARYVVVAPAGDLCDPGTIETAWLQYWPISRPGSNAVRIRCTAGYGDADGDLPKPIVQAMLILVADMYSTREETIFDGRSTPASVTAERLLRPFRIDRW